MRLTPWLSAIRNLGFGARRRQLQKRVARYGADSLEQLEDRTLLVTGTFQFALAAFSASEATTARTVDVTLTTDAALGAGDTMSIDVNLGGGSTATGGGVDYTYVNATVTFTDGLVTGAGTFTKQVTITVVDDQLLEGDQTVVLSLANAVRSDVGDTVSIGAPSTHTATIEDNESGVIDFQANQSNGENVDPTVMATLTISSASGAGGLGLETNLTVTASDAGGGTATSGTDYAAFGTPTLTFTAGAGASINSNTATLNVTDDQLLEGDQTVNLSIAGLSSSLDGQVMIVDSTHTATIEDNESGVIDFQANQANGENVDPTVMATLTISSASGAGGLGLETNLTVTASDAGGGTATSGTDYSAFGTPTLTFTAGAGASINSNTATLNVTDDNIVEANETVNLSIGALSNSLDGQVTLNDTTHTATINNNDTATISIGDVTANENGTFTLTISSTNPSDENLTGTINTADGTATLAGLDYTQISGGTFTITGNEVATSTTVTVTVNNDTLVEGSENFTVDLTSPLYNGGVDASRVVLGDASGLGTITDNDTAAITFSAATSSVSEGGTSTSFTATLTITANGVSGTGTLDRAVSFDVSDNGPAGTANGAGDDYTFTTQSYTYPIGSVSGNLKTVNLTVHEDIEDEADETVVLQFSNLSDGTGGQVTTGANHTVTILDNDTSAVVFNAPTGNGLDAFRIVRNGANLEIYDNAVLIDSQPVAGITSLTIQGANGENDTFEVDLTGGDIVPSGGLFFNGGTGGTDSLKITGGSQGNVTYNYTNANDGSVVMTAFGTVNYTGLEPIANTGTAANIIFNLPDTADALITLADLVAGTSARLQSGVPTFEVTDFAIPVAGGSITINLGATTAQTIAVNALTLVATTDLIVDGQGGTDVIHLVGPVANLNDLTLSAETIDQTNAVTVAGATVLDAGGAGTITLATAGNNFNTVAITNSNTASIKDDGGFVVAGATATTSITLESAGGTVTETAAISAPTLTLQGAAGTFSLGSQNNAVTFLDADNSALTALTFKDDDGYSVSGINATTTTLESVGGTVTQTGVITATTLTLQGAGGTFTLDTQDNAITTLDADDSTLAALAFRDNTGFAVDGAIASGNITLSTTATVTQTDVISASGLELLGVGGTFTLNTQNNAITTLAGNTGVVAFQDNTGFAIGTVNTAGLTAVTSVTLSSTGTVTESQAIVSPLLTLEGTGGIYSLGTNNNDVDTLDANNSVLTSLSFRDDDGFDVAGATMTGSLTLNASTTGPITQTVLISAGTTNLTGGAITLTLANVFGAITVNNGVGAVSITENATMDISAITHNTGLLTLQAGANTINVNGPIAITGGNADFLTTGTLNLNDNVTATVITGTPVIVNVNNNTAEIQDGVDAALAGATVNVNDNVIFSENVSIPKNLTLLATLDGVIIAGGAGGAALTVTGGIVSATGFYMNTASASSTVNVTGGSLTLRNNAIVESSGAAAAAITVGAGGALNMGVNATSTPGNNSITLSGAGTLLSNAVPVDASGNYWGSNVFATITAGISSPATVDYSPYLNNGTNLAGIGFQGDFSDLTAHAGGSQLGVAAITEAYNMLTAVGTIHALTGTYTESVDLGAGANKAVTLHAGASPGQVVITGSLTLTANDTLPIELDGYVPPDALPPTGEGTTFDNFEVHGTVTLGGATLVPSVNYAAVPFDRFTIINNLSGGAVVGTFGGLPEGSIINVGGVRLRISYVEFHNPGSFPATPSFFGDGDDVSLTVMTPPVLVEYTTDGSLIITGTGWVDDITVDFTGTNMVTLIGNDVTNFFGPGTAGQTAGPYVVTGNISMSLGNSNDLVFLRGTGAGATFDSGNMLIELGSGNDSVTTTDITAPITLTSGVTFTGDLTILGGTGDDVISLGGLAAADTFSANAISIDTGTGGIQSVALDRTTVGTNVSIKNGGAAAQSVALGLLGPNSVGRDLTITQADGATSYLVGIRDTNVGRHLQVTNGNGSGIATVTVDTTVAGGARSVGGLTQITNGNNLTNLVTLVGTASSLQFVGNMTVKNGTATAGNAIIVTDVTNSGSSASSFTNGTSPVNSIAFNGALANTFLGTVAATNGLSTGTNAIIASRLSARGVTFKNGDATTSNTITLGGALATDTFTVAGNTSLTNGASADIVVNVDRLTANVPSGNVTIANGASGAGGTDVIIGAVAAANSITGNLTITNQVSTGTRTNTINNATVSGGGGLSINDFGSGISAINIGTTALVTVARKLDIQDGSSSATTTIDTATVGSMTYNDLGGGTDTINLANAAGTFQNNGVTRLNLGAGSDTVNIAIAGTAIFNDSVFISLGSGNDVLNIGANANSPAFSAANRFQFDGGAGVDQITVSPLSIADYVVGNVPKKLKSKITNFESIL